MERNISMLSAITTTIHANAVGASQATFHECKKINYKRDLCCSCIEVSTLWENMLIDRQDK